MKAQRKPKYTVLELARMLGIDYQTLYRRIKNSANKPEIDFAVRDAGPSPIFGTELSRNSSASKAGRYEKEAFMRWYQREWIDSGKANSKATNEN